MIVDALESRPLGGAVERSARVRWEGGEFRLRIAVPPEHAGPADDGSPFLAATLQLAMRRGEELEVRAPVSERLLGSCGTIQEVYAACDPRLRRATVQAAGSFPASEPAPGAGCFFSRGVDSTYSAACERRKPLTHLIFCDGLEPRHDASVRAQELRLAAEAARDARLPLVTARTNLRELTDPLLADWEDFVAPALAFAGHALAGGFGRVVIPSSDSYPTVEPVGTSPLLDPLFSTERVAVEHDAVDKGRLEKIVWLAGARPELVKHLKVCFLENRPDNCGRCGKCLLTMAGLQAAGALGAAANFPAEIDYELIATRRIRHVKARYEWASVCRLLGQSDDDQALRRAVILAFRRSAIRDRPGAATSFEPRGFRDRRLRAMLSLLIDGRPDPPIEGWDDVIPEEEPAGARNGHRELEEGIGLLRLIDRSRGAHSYSAGSVAPGELVGELGSLLREPGDGRLPLWIRADGLVRTDDYAPGAPGASRRLTLRWVVAPLAWTGLGRFSTRAAAAAGRAARAAHRNGGPSVATEPSDKPSGYLHRDAGPDRLPLYAGVHPVTGDQLLSTWRWEAVDLGYVDVTLLGHLEVHAPVTGRVGTARPHLPWASRFGQRVRPW